MPPPSAGSSVAVGSADSRSTTPTVAALLEVLCA